MITEETEFEIKTCMHLGGNNNILVLQKLFSHLKYSIYAL